MAARILRLKIVSYGGIVNKEIVWDEDYSILAIIGDGGTGKSSIEGFAEACLTGVIPDEAINIFTGKARGTMEFEKDGKKYVIDISKTKKSETVKISNEDKMSSGKEVLRNVVGRVAVDPFSICKKKPEEQIEYFQQIFHIDTTALETQYQNIYQSRTTVNRQKKDLIGFLNLDGAASIDAAAKAEKYKEEKVLGDLPEKMTTANVTNTARLLAEQEIENTKTRKVGISGKVDTNLAEIKQLEDYITDLENKIATAKGRINDRQLLIVACNEEMGMADNIITEKTKWLAETPAVDVSDLQRQIDEINEYNVERGKHLIWMAKYDEYNKKVQESKDLTQELKNKEAEILKAITDKQGDLKNIKLYVPVKPTEEEETTDAKDAKVEKPAPDDRLGLYWRDKPISVLSTTEKMQFGFELQAEINPGFPILLLDDFESVGSGGRAELVKMCQDKGWTALVTIVDPRQGDLKIELKNDLNENPPKQLTTEELEKLGGKKD